MSLESVYIAILFRTAAGCALDKKWNAAQFALQIFRLKKL